MKDEPIRSYYWLAGYQDAFHRVPRKLQLDSMKARGEYADGYRAGSQAFTDQSKESSNAK